MTHVESWILGYLINSLWQAPLILIAGWLAATALRAHGATTVHRVWVCCLLLQSLLPACSAHPEKWLYGLLYLISSRWHGERVVEVSVVMGSGSLNTGLLLGAHFPAILIAIYSVLLTYLFARLVWGICVMLALQQRSVAFDLSDETASFWRRCCQRFANPSVCIAHSARISSPMTMGVLKHIILVPDGMTKRVTTEDMQTVIAHEFAHIGRHDFASNLLQELISLPVAYHPALWLARSRVVESREIVCDEIAAEAVAGREHYARSLLRLAATFVDGSAIVAPHAIGIFDASTFERRIMKLTTIRKESRGVRRSAILTACVVCGLGTCMSAMALRASVSLTSAEKNCVIT